MSKLVINEGIEGHSVFYPSVGGYNLEIEVGVESGLGSSIAMIDKADAVKLIKHFMLELNIMPRDLIKGMWSDAANSLEEEGLRNINAKIRDISNEKNCSRSEAISLYYCGEFKASDKSEARGLK